MLDYILPSAASESDSTAIIAAIAEAKASGVNRVRIPRENPRTGADCWIIDETIALPSDIEILIDDAHLILAEGKFLNMFTIGDPAHNTPADTIRNVTLRGRGRAVLDGGVYNGLHEKNANKDGWPDIYLNTTCLFFNAENLTVENLSLINQRWWAITNIFVRGAVYRNIRFRADFSRKDENGVHYPDEKPRTYQEVYVKNADGIDLRVGCHDFVIENICGFTEDDSIALTALGGGEKKRGYYIDDADADIHDVVIRNVATESYCANIRLLNDNGYKLYNVDIDGVTSLREIARGRSTVTVRIGDMVYANEHSTLGDTHHITVRNVISRQDGGVSICKGLTDSVIENITVLEKGGYGVGAHRNVEATLQRCTIGAVAALAEGSVAVREDGLTVIE